MNRPLRIILFKTLAYPILILFAVLSLVPFFWLVCASLKPRDIFTRYTFLPPAAEGGKLLTVGDLRTSPEKFVTRISENKDPVSQLIRQNLSPKTEEMLKAFVPGQFARENLKKGLIDDLNRMIQEMNLYSDPAVFKDANLSAETRKFVGKTLGKEEQTDFNRLLLKDAFPDEIARTEWSKLTFDNYYRLFTQIPFLNYIINSAFVTCVGTLLTVFLSAAGGFALAKYQFRGKHLVYLLMSTTLFIPGELLLPSVYDLVYKIGWINSYYSILVPGAVSVFGMFLFRQAMLGVPDDLIEAARIDGCSELRIFWSVALPIVRPMIGAFTLIQFLGLWNSFMWPGIILQTQEKYTLPIALNNMVGLYQQDYGLLMAGTLMGIIPVMLLFFALQKEFISGLTAGAVKG